MQQKGHRSNRLNTEVFFNVKLTAVIWPIYCQYTIKTIQLINVNQGSAKLSLYWHIESKTISPLLSGVECAFVT